MSAMKETVVFYHADCYDGFGGAFSAYKKFGDSASYIPLRHDGNGAASHLNGELTGKDIYMIDFCSLPDVMKDLEARARSLTVLDHHKSAEETVKALKNHRYALDHSGAYLAWEYFHPGTQVPYLIRYIEDGDLFKFSLPNSEAILTLVQTQPFDFAHWERLKETFDDPKQLDQVAKKGAIYEEYFNLLVQNYVKQAKEVEFDGYRIMAVHAPREYRSHVGHELSNQKGPFSIVWYVYDKGLHFSMRGDGSIDVSKIAIKHGGGGHHNAASFTIPVDLPLPWKRIDNS